MKKLILIAVIFLALLQSVAFCQTGSDAVTTAVNNLKSQLTNHMVEKAYLHFDRPYPLYVAGESVYFKAYVFMGERHEATTISSILHVDLINKNDFLMQTISLQLIGGTGWGDFALPDTLQKGSYRIRAYTEWMRNDKHPYYFDQYISVGSINNVDQVAANTTQTAKPDLQFFPEGGALTADVPSKVAFKATGTNGLSVGVKGIVIDNEHKEVAKLNVAHLGMGEFNFIPETGKTYKAMVTYGDGSQETVALPDALPSGIRLAVNVDDPAKLSIEIRANLPYYKRHYNEQLSLLIYYAGALKRYSPKLDNSILGLDLSAGAFPTGIVQISLLSETGEPLCERLVFVQNPDMLNLSLTANKITYAPRGNVQLSLLARDKDGVTVSGSFSVSVVDESKILVDETVENSLPSWLLLTSEVKGHIEKPNFYFTNVTKETRSDLDILMLAQGYRRFDWKEFETNAPATANAFDAEKQIDISGVLKSKSGVPLVNCKINLIPQAGEDMFPMVQTTDDSGRFKFVNVSFSTGIKFILKVQSSAGRNAVLTMDKPGPPPLVTKRDQLDSKYNSTADLLASLQNNIGQGIITTSNSFAPLLLQNANNNNNNNNRTGPISKYNYRSSNLGGPGHADQVVFGKDLVNSSSLSLALKGLLHGVNFSGDSPYLQTSLVTSAAVSGSQGFEPMLVTVDGVQLGTGANINDIDPVSVETVEVLKGPNAAIYGVDGGSGVLVITTKQGGEREETIGKVMSPGIFSIEPRGFYKAREFYSPKYDVQVANNHPDNRTTIFWKPDVITDGGGNALLNYFNADGKGTYRVEVQGIDSRGNIGMQVLRYKVE